jgi:hypothetical protein
MLPAWLFASLDLDFRGSAREARKRKLVSHAAHSVAHPHAVGNR